MPQKQINYSSINSSLRLFHLLPYKMKILLWLLLAGMILKAIIETLTMSPVSGSISPQLNNKPGGIEAIKMGHPVQIKKIVVKNCWVTKPIMNSPENRQCDRPYTL
jgi:hypothetical protein